VPAPPVPDAAPVPLLVGHAPGPAPQPYPDACRPRSLQARRQARRTSQVHSTEIPSTATATTTKAVTIASPLHRGGGHRPATGPGAPGVRTMPPAPVTSIAP
jgi:hypothetical protein